MSPRFGIDRTVELDGVPHDLPPNEAFKVSFALLSLQVTTPWITVSTGTGRYLSHLELGLTASGDSVTAVRWSGEYLDEHDDSGPPQHIGLRLVWDVEQVAAALHARCGATRCDRSTVAAPGPTTTARCARPLPSTRRGAHAGDRPGTGAHPALLLLPAGRRLPLRGGVQPAR